MKFYIYTLGCKVNTYESNVIKDKLINSGYIEGNEDDSDIYIINTCTVTNTSDNKSLKVIRRVINNYPNAYSQFENEISIPLYSKLTDEDVEYIIDSFIKVLGEFGLC